MQISTEQFLYQIDHLLSGIETEDQEAIKEIQRLRSEVKGLLHMTFQGHEVAVQLGIDMLRPQIDELILTLRY